MILGAEFHRHVWQRFSLFSILLLPFLIAVGLGLCYMSYLLYGVDTKLEYSQQHWAAHSLFLTIPLLVIILHVYGTYEAASSFTTELRNKTWDLPRTSAIRPVHLVLGKLFGTTSAVWYHGLGTLAVVLYAYANMHIRQIYPGAYDVQSLAFCVVVSAFTGHLAATLASLRNLIHGRTGSFAAFVFGIIAAYWSWRLLVWIFRPDGVDGLGFFFIGDISIKWFGHDVPAAGFLLGSYAFFVACALVGLQRMARRVLSFQSYPFVWIGFLTLFSLYFIGFDYEGNVLYREDIWLRSPKFFAIPFFIFLCAAFSDLLHMSSNVGAYLRFFASVRRRKSKRMIETIPAWIPTGVITLVMLVLWLVTEAAVSTDTMAFGAKFSVLVSLLLFLIRDSIVMHILLLGKRFRRGGFLCALYFVFVYVILPQFAFMFVALNGPAAGIEEVFSDPDSHGYVLGVFFPSPQKAVVPAIAPVLLEILVFGRILWRVTGVYRQKQALAPK